MRSWAARLPPAFRLGTSSWYFPGWEGLVFDRAASLEEVRAHGLKAYAQHPLLRTVSVDRTFYAPVSSQLFEGYARDVPDDFRFVVKAHDVLTLIRFPNHARYGARRGEANDRYLSAPYATDAVVGPFVQGLGEKGGALVFQFSPMGQEQLDPESFPDRLHRFLAALPRGPRYAVEVRNPSLITPRYGQALAAAGAIHALNVWGAMPALETQAELTAALDAEALMVRWMLPSHLAYEAARARYQPFNKLIDVDPAIREAVLRLCRRSLEAGKPAFVLINNKAEGSAPLTAFALAEAYATASSSGSGSTSR